MIDLSALVREMSKVNINLLYDSDTGFFKAVRTTNKKIYSSTITRRALEECINKNGYTGCACIANYGIETQEPIKII